MRSSVSGAIATGLWGVASHGGHPHDKTPERQHEAGRAVDGRNPDDFCGDCGERLVHTPEDPKGLRICPRCES